MKRWNRFFISLVIFVMIFNFIAIKPARAVDDREIGLWIASGILEIPWSVAKAVTVIGGGLAFGFSFPITMWVIEDPDISYDILWTTLYGRILINPGVLEGHNCWCFLGNDRTWYILD